LVADAVRSSRTTPNRYNDPLNNSFPSESFISKPCGEQPRLLLRWVWLILVFPSSRCYHKFQCSYLSGDFRWLRRI